MTNERRWVGGWDTWVRVFLAMIPTAAAWWLGERLFSDPPGAHLLLYQKSRSAHEGDERARNIDGKTAACALELLGQCEEAVRHAH